MLHTRLSKTAFARTMGISRSLLYYRYRKPDKDWALKQRIEAVLHEHPSYGHRRISLHLTINKKKVLRVMHLFGMKPYRRRGRKPRYRTRSGATYPNLLLTEYPRYPHHLWATDFTFLSFRGRWVYLATVMDLATREIVGASVLTAHSTQLVMNALLAALQKFPAPAILHSDHGSEYASQDYDALTMNLGITRSMSRKGCPWENGYQESFYSQFKVDLGDPNRFASLGELVYAIYQTIHSYNHRRIHTTLRMPPAIFAARYQRSNLVSDLVS